jgi:hypothetical protein
MFFKKVRKGDPLHLHPMNRPNSLKTQRAIEKKDRRERLKKFMEESTSPLTIDEISLKFLVNVSTIRRDLKALGIPLRKS